MGWPSGLSVIGLASPMDLRNPLIVSPRSDPKPFRRLVPNSMITINRMIRSFPVLKPPNPIVCTPPSVIAQFGSGASGGMFSAGTHRVQLFNDVKLAHIDAAIPGAWGTSGHEYRVAGVDRQMGAVRHLE